MRQLAYTMFIANNYALLHLRRKKHLVKHYKFSNYYEDDCSNDAKKTVRHANTTRRITQNGNNRPDQTRRFFSAKFCAGLLQNAKITHRYANLKGTSNCYGYLIKFCYITTF